MTRIRLVPIGMLILAGVTVGACNRSDEASESATPAASAPVALNSFDARVDSILGQMTLAEKIGQMTQPEQSNLASPEEVATYFIGSVFSGGGSDPKAGNSMQNWTDMYVGLQAQSQKTRLKIPILFGIDAVHGNNNLVGAVIFPHHIGLGATRDAALVEEIGRVTAEEVRATGIQWAFSPCVCVPRDERWGRTYEGFSEDPKLVAELGVAEIKGLQGASLRDPGSVLATAKHFAADGGTAMGTGVGLDGKGLDQGDARIDEATLRSIHLAPYPPAIEAGVGSIMPSFSSWNGLKMSAHHQLLTDVLKGEFGFQGFLISDYKAIEQLDPDFKTAIEKSINAGMDMAMVPDTYKPFIQNLTELVNEGRVPMSRIDDAVRRILRVKFAMGLMDANPPIQPDTALQRTFGSAEHREVARRAVRESMVLLKNDAKTLPLSKQAKRIHVAGKNADDIGNQAGGWTIDWQGKSGAVTTGGTTILAAMKKAAPGAQITYSLDGSGAAGADVGVVVIGETPYAEMMGDRADLSLDSADVAAVRTMKAAGIPVVVVLVSGRPMILGDVLGQADALVAAWLPGTEGDGVADVLFGDYKPTGKLSFSWPRSMAQIPINVGDADYDPLFPYGYGLSY
jgi:beta-glucosidase